MLSFFFTLVPNILFRKHRYAICLKNAKSVLMFNDKPAMNVFTRVYAGYFIFYIRMISIMSRVHPKLSLADGDTSQGKNPWSVSPPTTASKWKRQFGMHPISILVTAN